MTILRYIDNFDEILVLGNSRTFLALDHAAESIQEGAAERSRVDTGAMKDGWKWERINNPTRIVYNDVEYTIYNEYGTSRGLDAQPMLVPSVEETMPEFRMEVRRAWFGL